MNKTMNSLSKRRSTLEWRQWKKTHSLISHRAVLLRQLHFSSKSFFQFIQFWDRRKSTWIARRARDRTTCTLGPYSYDVHISLVCLDSPCHKFRQPLFLCLCLVISDFTLPCRTVWTSWNSVPPWTLQVSIFCNCATHFYTVNRVTSFLTTLSCHFTAASQCHEGRFKTCVGRSGGVAVVLRSSSRSLPPRRLAPLCCFTFCWVQSCHELLS